MSSLVVSGSGLDIKGLSTNSHLPMAMSHAIGLTLSNQVIEGLIDCVRSGENIQLSLDNCPSILYGTKIQQFEIKKNSSSHEIIRTRLPHAVLPLSNAAVPHPPPNSFADVRMTCSVMAMMGQKLIPINDPRPKTSTSCVSTASGNDSKASNADAALTALQNSLATESIRKAENTVRYIKDGSLPLPGKRGVVKSSKSMSSHPQSKYKNEANNKSLPLSPALSSKSVPLSQQQAEHAKVARKPVIHLLAVSPLTENALEAKIPASAACGLKQALEKVGDLNDVTGKWELRKAFYKELDVWSFNYDPPEDRQRAIDNAVKIFDKMRLNVSEPQWEKLLTLSERSTGKCLSKLQAQIAQASNQKAPQNSDGRRDTTPKLNNSKDEGGGDKAVGKSKGEPMVRSSSQVSKPKPKKVTKEKDSQAKRLLSKKPQLSGKSSLAKVATSNKRNQPAAKERKTATGALSSEFVESSDGEETPSVKPALPTARKRPRTNDEADVTELNMSPAKKVSREKPVTQNRIPNTSRTNSGSQFSVSNKSIKSNSPRKSSPLASSPPTNASDFEKSDSQSPNSESSQSQSSIVSRLPKKSSRSSITSCTRKVSNSSSRRLRPEVTDLARKYKMYYPKYLQLHEQITGMGDRRDRTLEKDLLEMHARLYAMKQEILAGIVDVNGG
ncbi:putative com1 regulatory protein [Golovinomyces cichoracearum]|uniref:Putative com1 regulatory protein n=1 Tax=Golovinomyces cichoracearum TaxID=62708 RepID=A0A420IYU4_9PEZI|nr:putative com1 regulatory protein [Golovinomyces cichoracearum]